MNLFCSKGGFHKYEYYIGPDPSDTWMEIECNRCVKCGKIFGSNEIISNEFIYEERKRKEEFFDNLKKELDEILNRNLDDCYSGTKQYQNIISFNAAKRKLKE